MEKNKIKKRILVVSHDAGGAEIVSSLVKEEKEDIYWFVITPEGSPAFHIFERKGLKEFIVHSGKNPSAACWLKKINPDFLLRSTSWSNPRFELSFSKEAKRQSIITVCFLDHWCRFRERFGYPKKGWEDNLTDYIAVGDRAAFHSASALGLPNLIKVKNYYFYDIINRYKEAGLSGAYKEVKRLLVFSEPISMRRVIPDGFNEYRLAEEVLNNFESLSRRYGVNNVTIRLHPSENKNKFNYLFKKFPGLKLNVEDPKQVNLADSFHNTKLSFGFESMPLFMSYLINKPFISYGPLMRDRNIPLPSKYCMQKFSSLPNITEEDNHISAKRLLFGSRYNLKAMLRIIKKSK